MHLRKLQADLLGLPCPTTLTDPSLQPLVSGLDLYDPADLPGAPRRPWPALWEQAKFKMHARAWQAQQRLEQLADVWASNYSSSAGMRAVQDYSLSRRQRMLELLSDS